MKITDENNFPTKAIKIEDLIELSEETLSNNDTIPISNLEGTKKLPLHRLKTYSKKLLLNVSNIVSNTYNMAIEDVLLFDMVFIEGLTADLTQDISFFLPKDHVQEGKKLLFYNTSGQNTSFGITLKQASDNSDILIQRIRTPYQKEELIYLDGMWQNINQRSQTGLIGLDIFCVGDPNQVILQRDFLLPYNGQTYNQIDYPELCVIKRLASDWKFDDTALTFTMPDYTSYFVRSGNASKQGTKVTDTMRKIKGTFSSIRQAYVGHNTINGAFSQTNWDAGATGAHTSDDWGSDYFFDSSKGIEGQEGQASPNVGTETAPQHVISTLYVIAK